MWYPNWALGRADAPPDEPVVVVEGNPARVIAASAAASSGQKVIGLLRRQVEALVPSALVLIRDRGEEARRFERVVSAIEDAVPRVEVGEPGLAYVPVGGAVRYYGTESQVAARVLDLIPPGAKIGLADGIFAARRAAEQAGEAPLMIEDTASFLADLEIEALGPGELVETFRWLGVTTLGALADLPRPAIASRFGQEGLAAHRLSCGEDRMPSPRSIPSETAVSSVHTDEPLTNTDQVAFVTRSLAVEMLSALRSMRVSPYRVEVQVEAADGSTRKSGVAVGRSFR